MTAPGERAAADQRHAGYRNLALHIGGHVRQALALPGVAPSDVVCRLAAELIGSEYKRRDMAHLFAVALVELEIAPHRRQR